MKFNEKLKLYRFRLHKMETSCFDHDIKAQSITALSHILEAYRRNVADWKISCIFAIMAFVL